MFRIIRSILLLIVLMNIGAPVAAADSGWESKVILVQASRGVRGFEEQARGVFVDTERTRLLNTLSADGWEFFTAIGVPGRTTQSICGERSNLFVSPMPCVPDHWQ